MRKKVNVLALSVWAQYHMYQKCKTRELFINKCATATAALKVFLSVGLPSSAEVADIHVFFTYYIRTSPKRAAKKDTNADTVGIKITIVSLNPV